MRWQHVNTRERYRQWWYLLLLIVTVLSLAFAVVWGLFREVTYE